MVETKMVTLTIEGRSVSVPDGTTILLGHMGTHGAAPYFRDDFIASESFLGSAAHA